MSERPIRLLRHFRCVLFLLVALCTPLWAAAQVNASDAAAAFGSLSPDQQQALLQQLGGQGGSMGGTRATDERSRQPRATTPAGQQDRRAPAAGSRAGADGMVQLGPPVLKAEDTVLIELSIRRDAAMAPMSGSAMPAGSAPTTPQPVGQGTAAAEGTQPMLSLAPEIVLTTDERRDAEKLIEAVRQRNPYVLDRNGALQLPGFAPIPLAGLTNEEASERISADPALRFLRAKLTLLPLEKSGLAALQPFGYDLFDNPPSTFAPVTNVPVPSDYIVGPGDLLDVQLYGSQNRNFSLIVNRDGRINFPQLGPIAVGSRRFSEVRAEIEQRVAKQMIGVSASLSMGDTRAIQVFVLGEAQMPGAYTVSGLATMTTALFASGGVKPIGSLRNIQLKRQGQLVRRLDLYDLLLRGDTSNDAKLLPGDVIFIPPLGPTVSVDGEVRRPAIYEFKGDESVADAVAMAGGLTTSADRSRAALTRIDAAQRRIVLDVDLGTPDASREALRQGDALQVARLRPQIDSGVVLQGHVHRPGNFAWRQGLRISDVITSVDELKPDADQHYVLIRRELPPDRRIAVLSADLAAALRAPGSAADALLEPRDRLTVFDLSTDRERIIEPLMDELKVQGAFNQPTETVSVSGRVKVPGNYPLEPGMRVADLIRAGGMLDAAAFGGSAELSRYVVENGEVRRAQVIPVDLTAVLGGDAAANIELEPYDGLYIKEISGWTKQEQVRLEGEVRFPGTYPIRPGETLHSVIERAGGLTELAFAEGAVFTREELRLREQEQLDRLSVRMQNDLTTMSLMAARANQGGAQQTYSIGQSLLAQLKSAKAVGRLVINLGAILKAPEGSPADVGLRDRDVLVVPKRSQEVTVMGEVQTVTSHLYNADLHRGDYISLSGGYTRAADKKHVYVVRANGGVVSGSSGFFFRSDPDIRPGDTIVAPLNTDRMPMLPLWQSVTQILYNIAIATAAVNAL